MGGEGIYRTFEGAGWEVRGEEGSSRAEAGGGRYTSRSDERLPGHETVYELEDRELDMSAYARKVSGPGRAAELLERYGVPAGMSEATPGKVPMVPPGSEEDG